MLNVCRYNHNANKTFTLKGAKLIKNRIKALRIKHVLAQEHLTLARHLAPIISIEKYKYKLSLELAFKIARPFNTSMEEIFSFEEEN